ncbi:DUF1566 domain-containing protein [Pseudoalteromonas sp. Of11M-6]|uniref:Lcl C-terminal domain-containing protein n=1 Tax=Pseudoalteromonas sp. Of11M-6 TaxID=2917754 RepID=UPI001EF5954A|nr:DUF1566 domain-containing protein [Pseudoalteromonas sp. Of11M-6]MCG7555837.1 DUF1566 domain-containing protein [Pseudoalteromonas sp. Of11M-6]
MRYLLVTLSLSMCFTVQAIEQACSQNIERSSPSVGFIDNKDGTVTDRATQLTWMRCSIGQTFNAQTSSCDGMPTAMYWQDALKTAEKIRTSPGHAIYQYAGIKNWRLPNIKELNSIREVACVNPAVNQTVFPNIFAIAEAEGGYAYVWSATPLASEAGVMYMDLNGGSLASTFGLEDYERQILLVADKVTE